MKKFKHIVIFLLFTITLHSQKDARFIDNVRFGGGINMALGSNFTTFAISPSVIYDFSEKFAGGISLTYVYVKTKSDFQSTTNLFGGSLIILYQPIKKFQISSELEQLKVDRKFILAENISEWQPAWYVGLEYVTGNLSMGLRYDVLFDKQKNLLYSSALSPVFRVYF